MANVLKLSRNAALIALVVAGAGCMPPVPLEDQPTHSRFQAPELNLSAEAGRNATIIADPGNKSTFDLANSIDFGGRADPFALLAVEKVFDRQQASERVLADFGGSFSVFYEPPPPPPDETTVMAPVPQGWRLSAVLIGDGIGALLERSPGDTIEIRPGQQIQGTEWTVVSIDEERAVLRRSADMRPSTFVVRLQSRGADFGGGGGGGTSGGGGSGGGGGGTGGGGGLDGEGGGMGDR
ncbi:MAG: hypothetical protein HONBIEJF_01132 [Fimbriimonadaceae bacterium]|nr:hypothetical protein [Fimbriimonadaceae bacterium]